MKATWVLSLCAILILIILLILFKQPKELFIDSPNLENIQDPAQLLKRMRGLLEKYDKPEVWGSAAQMMDKDPGTLARMHLGILNST